MAGLKGVPNITEHLVVHERNGEEHNKNLIIKVLERL